METSNATSPIRTATLGDDIWGQLKCEKGVATQEKLRLMIRVEAMFRGGAVKWHRPKKRRRK